MPLTRITNRVIEDGTVVAVDIGDNQIGIQQLNVSDGSSGDMLTTDGAGNLSFQTLTQVSGSLSIGGANFIGYTSSAAAPTTTELPTTQDWSFHKDTNAGTLYLAFNDGGVIKTVTLT